MTDTDLLPCWCNGKARLFKRSGTRGISCSKFHREHVECMSCGLRTRECKKPGQAIKAWNARTPQPSPQSDMAAVPREVLVKLFDDIQAVTCDPTGTVCIHGSDGDRAVIQEALSMLQPYTKGQ